MASPSRLLQCFKENLYNGILDFFFIILEICHIAIFVRIIYMVFAMYLGSRGGSDGKVSACNAGDPGLIPGLGRSPGERNGNPLQYSCLENPMDREA